MIRSASERFDDARRNEFAPALVIGGGASAVIASKALLGLGIPVTLAIVGSSDSWLFCSDPELSVDDAPCSRPLFSADFRSVTLDTFPATRRKGAGFSVSLERGIETYFGCIVLASGVSPKPIHPDLPEGVELIRPGSLLGKPGTIAFLLDYETHSHPAVGMNVMRQAIENRVAGGISFVLFQHAPVRRLFGETLYEEAKKSGVTFVRYGHPLPSMRSRNSPGSEKSLFTLVTRDIVEMGDELVIECDRVLTAPVPNALSLEQWLIELASHDLDSEGFMLSPSIHCHSGASFRNGIFAVGECTGNFDLLGVLEQAASAAVKVRAWLRESHDGPRAEGVSFSKGCIRCLTCYRICPHRAISFTGDESMPLAEAAPGACHSCGTCVSECPRMVLDLPSFPETGVSQFLDDLAQSKEIRPVVVYGCERSAGLAAPKVTLPSGTVFFSFPCAGRISEAILVNTLAAGAGGVLVAGCHHGNCSSEKGTDWAKARVTALFEKLGLSNRIRPTLRYVSVSANEPARFRRLVEEFCDSLNPERK